MDVSNINLNDKVVLEERFDKLYKDFKDPVKRKEGGLMPILEMAYVSQQLDLIDEISKQV